jgi:hypothetical protein
MLIVEVGSEGPEWERLTNYQRDAREEQGGLLSPSAVILLGGLLHAVYGSYAVAV